MVKFLKANSMTLISSLIFALTFSLGIAYARGRTDITKQEAEAKVEQVRRDNEATFYRKDVAAEASKAQNELLQRCLKKLDDIDNTMRDMALRDNR